MSGICDENNLDACSERVLGGRIWENLMRALTSQCGFVRDWELFELS